MAPPNRFILHLPNILTALRLGMGVTFPFVADVWRLPLVIAGGGTDFLDGLIARRFNASTWYGGLLDVIADKTFTLIVLIVLTVEHRLAWWQLLLLLVRDIAVGMGCLALILRRRWGAFRMLHSRWPGRVTTFLLFAFFVGVLGFGDFSPLRNGLFIGAAIFSVIAAVDYLRQYLTVMRSTGGSREGAINPSRSDPA